MTVDQLTPAEAAACLKSFLEGRGARFSLGPGGHLKCDLNPCRFVRDRAHAEQLSTAVLSLAEEIKAILRAERIAH